MEAITHGSYANHPSYQRIEFVGDTVLGLAVSHYLYKRYPDIGSDDQTTLRRTNVSNEKLSRVAVRLGLYRFPRRNSPSLDQAVSDFTDLVTREEEEDDGNSSEPFSQVNDFTDLVTREEEEDGGRISYCDSIVEACTILADMVGSIALAFYWDSDLKLVGKVN
ncbi:ribonuclease 3-like protein 2 [Zingiber officinale]|uniref:ribonuclease 3-like protein 2 n=1 Tax=Zingiber officinale TaxID=94328 RepID=UPI001C4CAA42|nr:ribonuclease 3-like protein 2 [Zingiber officinale]